MSKWIAQVTVATLAPLEEQDLVTLDEASSDGTLPSPTVLRAPALL